MALLLSAAVLEVVEAEEVFPGAAEILVAELAKELSAQSGCEFERRWCELQTCGGTPEGTASGLTLRLYLVVGAQKLSVTLEGVPDLAPIEELWPVDAATWPDRTRSLARLAFREKVCEPAALIAPSAELSSASGPEIISVVALIASVAALGAGIGLHVLASDATARADGFTEWQPEVGRLRDQAEAQTLVGHVLLSTALGLAGVAILSEALVD